MGTSLRTLSVAALVAVIGVSAAACHSPATLPTPTLKTEEFSGTVPQGGVSNKSFNIDFIAPTDAKVTVKSLTSAATGSALNTTIGVAFGTLLSDGSCIPAVTAKQDAATVGTPYQTQAGLFPTGGTYCVQVFDAGTLTGPANYTISVEHY